MSITEYLPTSTSHSAFNPWHPTSSIIVSLYLSQPLLPLIQTAVYLHTQLAGTLALKLGLTVTWLSPPDLSNSTFTRHPTSQTPLLLPLPHVSTIMTIALPHPLQSASEHTPSFSAAAFPRETYRDREIDNPPTPSSPPGFGNAKGCRAGWCGKDESAELEV